MAKQRYGKFHRELITHAEQLKHLLAAIQLPKQIAVVKCAAHTGNQDKVSLGNAFADKIGKEAAEGLHLMCNMTEDSQLTNDVLKDMQHQSSSTEKQYWINKGATEKDGIYY